ncbi:MAG: hypothetical protein A4S17_12620 [Proteobacteria bacterium HN_bin10]|nr:MAG: hypothetical protein A4S17_12620 [Proteobacteria bacterium HN_bin10]
MIYAAPQHQDMVALSWTAGALAGMRSIEQAPALVGSGGAVPARAPAVHNSSEPSNIAHRHGVRS